MSSKCYKENDYGHNLDFLAHFVLILYKYFTFHILLEVGVMLKVFVEDLLTLFIEVENCKHSWKHKLKEWPSCFPLST